MTTKNFQTLFALLAKRLEVYSEKDPKVIKQIIEKIDQEVKERPILKKLVDLEYRLSYAMLVLSDQLSGLLECYRHAIPSEYKSLFDSCMKIRVMKSNLMNIIKQIITSDIFEGLKQTDNSYIAKALAYQEALKFIGLSDNEIQRIFEKYKVLAKGLEKEIEELKKTLTNIKKDIDAKLHKLNVKQESFEFLKQIIRKSLEKLLSFAYRLYKKASIIITKIDNWIRNKIATVQNKVIQKIAGDNTTLQLALYAMFAAMGLTLRSEHVQSTIRNKLSSYKYTSKIQTALSSLPVMGALKFALGFVSVIYTLNKIEMSVVSNLQQASSFINNALSALDELDKTIEEIG